MDLQIVICNTHRMSMYWVAPQLQWLIPVSNIYNGRANNIVQYASDVNVLGSSSVAMVDRLQWLRSPVSRKKKWAQKVQPLS